jgi:hypothetical protein
LPVSAATGGFVSSPSGNKAPEIVRYENKSSGCTAELIVCAYADRDQLSPDARREIEEAYATIKGTQDLSTLNAQLGAIAAKLGVAVSDLAISDLFDITCNADGENHEEHAAFEILLKAETLPNFVALLHFKDGEWEIIEEAKVVNDENYLSFEADDFSPYAIVVYTGKKLSDTTIEEKPNNDDVLVATTAVSTTGVIGISAWLIATKLLQKKKDDEDGPSDITF